MATAGNAQSLNLSSIVQSVQKTVVATTTTPANIAAHLNLTPLMMLVAVLTIILVCCVCLVSYNSVLKQRQQREIGSKHISYGVTGEEFLSTSIIVRLCGFRQCMRRDNDEGDDNTTVSLGEDTTHFFPSNHGNERDPLVNRDLRSSDYQAFTNNGEIDDDSDDVIYSSHPPTQRTLTSNEIVVHDATK